MNKAVFGLAIIPILVVIFLISNQDENTKTNEQELSLNSQVQSPSTRECTGSARCIIGTVTQVIDGDTIKIDGQSIRFALASAPEITESGGQEAREFIAKLCPVGSMALVNEDDGQAGGGHDRILGMIQCNGENLNEELIESGHGYLDSGFCDRSEFVSTTWAQKFGCGAGYEMPKFSSPNLPDIKPKQPETSTTQPKQEDKEKPNCDSSYPGVCIPPYPPDLNCKDVPYKNFKVLQPDPHRFDGDKDGVGCEK